MVEVMLAARLFVISLRSGRQRQEFGLIEGLLIFIVLLIDSGLLVRILVHTYACLQEHVLSAVNHSLWELAGFSLSHRVRVFRVLFCGEPV